MTSYATAALLDAFAAASAFALSPLSAASAAFSLSLIPDISVSTFLSSVVRRPRERSRWADSSREDSSLASSWS